MRFLSIVVSLAALSVPAVALPPTGPSRDLMIRDWYCRYCVAHYRDRAEECAALPSEWRVECLGDARREFFECLAYCGDGLLPHYLNEIMGLFDDGLLDSWDVARALEILASN